MTSDEMRQQVGQLFMVGLPGIELDDSTLRLIREQRINNFIIFKRNVETPAQLKKLCASLKDACLSEELPPPLISIDQEGGTVARLSAPFTRFPDARKLAEDELAEELLKDFARTCAQELLGVGINMNLAPVLDVCPVGQGFFMELRSLGEDPERVAELGALVVSEMQQAGLAACAKHFPGLGGAVLDPHEQLPVVARSRQEMISIDLVPFREAMAVEVAAIMTSHTVYPQLDPDQPATLSFEILSGLLREQLKFDGLVITDDLEMGAIENDGSVADAALVAVNAGADMLLICHDHQKIIDAHYKLLKALSEAKDYVRLQKSFERVAAVRSRFVGS
jgi:beta-N-acetylhexosaminidase